MGKVIAIVNQKGGVGKTTTTLNFGAELVKRGFDVLLVDFDSQGNLTLSTGLVKRHELDELPYTIADAINSCMEGKTPEINPYPIYPDGKLDIIPCNDKMASDTKMRLTMSIVREKMLDKVLEQVKDNYDYVLIDTAPSLDVDMINALSACDEVFITTSPDAFSIYGTRSLFSTFSKVKNNLNPKIEIAGVLITCTDTRTNFSKEMMQSIREVWGDIVHIFDTVIPISVKVKEAQAASKPVADYAPDNAAAKAYSLFTAEYLKERKMEWEELEERNYEVFIKKYGQFMVDEKNILNCENCPENRGFDDYGHRRPCGQYNCWVEATCRNTMEKEVE